MTTLALDFDSSEIQQLTSHIEDPALDQQLINIDNAVKRIQSYCTKKYIANFYDPIRVELGKIRDAVDVMIQLFRKHNFPSWGQKTKEIVLRYINPFTEALEDAAEMSVEERKDLEEKTTQLWQGQATSHPEIMKIIKKKCQR
jgi:hypothetical protein